MIDSAIWGTWTTLSAMIIVLVMLLYVYINQDQSVGITIGANLGAHERGEVARDIDAVRIVDQ